MKMTIKATRSSNEDRHWVISVFSESGSGFGVALTADKSSDMVNKEFAEKLETIW